jgi:NADPH-dependent curcumin reductase CurA
VSLRQGELPPSGSTACQTAPPLLNNFARVPVSGLVAQYNDAGPGDGADRLPDTMRAILFKSLTVRGFINYDFAAEHYPAFLREVGAGIADGRIRYREKAQTYHNQKGGTD